MIFLFFHQLIKSSVFQEDQNAPSTSEGQKSAPRKRIFETEEENKHAEGESAPKKSKDS